MDHGRPSKYDDKFCDEVITFMSYGKSFEAFAGHKGVSKSTLYNWVAAHPEFQAAKEIANSKSQDWWESQMIDGLWESKDSLKLNNTVWIFAMKNRFGWRDKIEHTVDSTNTSTVDLNILNNFEKEY